MEGSWKVLGRNEKSLVNWDSVHLLVNQPDPGSWLTCSHQANVMSCHGQQITPSAGRRHACSAAQGVAAATEVFWALLQPAVCRQ